MKRIPTWLIIVLFLGLIIASKFIFFSDKVQKQNPAAKGQQAPLAVNYFVVQPSKISNNVFAAGNIGAMNQVEILPEVSGKITAIYFKEGETVSKGSVLVKLNDADLQAQLTKIRTQLKLSEQKLGRLKKLLEISGVSQEEYEMQENEVLALKADEAFTAAQVQKTTIVAPFTGRVGLRNVSEGSFVNASTPIVSLVQVKPVYVEFSIPEKYNQMFRKGLEITFSTDDPNADNSYEAAIYAIEPRVDETTKTIRARAMYNGNKELYPGSFVKVHVNLGTTSNALMVPTQAVIPTLKGQKVFLSRNKEAVEVPVKIGVRTEDLIQVTEGLSAGDTVITTGLLSVKQGSKLKLTGVVK
jgi:membrane fusion protein (multidrug efflux system)